MNKHALGSKETASRAAPVLSVDDNPMMADVIAMLTSMSNEFEHAGHFLSHEGVLEKIQQGNIKMLVLDYEIPGTDTLGLIRDINAACPDCKVLMLSAHGRRDIVEACKRAGAAGYALKDQNPATILDTMQKIWRGESAFPRPVTSKAWLSLPWLKLRALTATIQQPARHPAPRLARFRICYCPVIALV